MQKTRRIEKVVKKIKLTDKTNDATYWRMQPYSARLAALEEIRREYHRWRYGVEPKIEKVVTIIKAPWATNQT